MAGIPDIRDHWLKSKTSIVSPGERKLLIKKIAPKGPYAFEVDAPSVPGSPAVGRGSTMNNAIANWLRANTASLGLSLELDDTALPAEKRRRTRELAKR